MKSNCFLLLFLLFTFQLAAQKTEKIKNIKGSAFISGDVSPNQAKAKALNDAKLNALKAAGIGENIKSYELLFTSQQNNDYSQFFNSDIQSEIQGAVQSFDIVKEETIQKSSDETVVEVTIDATVIMYASTSDVKFDEYIEGIKVVYTNEDKLVFSVKTTLPCYLTIFNITDIEASVLYPNSYEKQELLNESILYSFPTVESIDYTLHTDMNQTEVNRLIFVFTKTKIPFIKMDKDQLITQQESIFTWIYSIMPDQRKVEYRALTIQK